MNKYLVTGGTGFIGRHLVDHLLEDGVNPKNIRLLVRTVDKLPNLRKKGVELVLGDITNKVDVEKAVRGVDVIYHLAAKTGGNATPENEINKVNIEGTRNLASAVVANGVKKIIHFSSVAVYGSPGIVTLRNVSEKYPKLPSDVYGLSKLKAEEVLVKTLSKGSTNYIIIRPTHTFGPGSKSGLNRIIQAVKNRYFFFAGNGENKVDFIYVKDVVRLAREVEKSEIANDDLILASGGPQSMKEVVETISYELEVNFPKVHISTNLVLLGASIASFLFQILGAKPFISPNGVKALTADYYFNINKLKKFGFKPNYSFRNGVAETIKYI